MFDEQQADDNLENIHEQPIEEESNEGDESDDEMALMAGQGPEEYKKMAESRAQRMQTKEEL